MQVSRKIKLEVSDQNATMLESMQTKCRGLYNWWVIKLRNQQFMSTFTHI
jgi:putative transposase